MSTIRIAEVSISTLGAFLEACAAHPTADLTELGEFAGFSHSTAKKAIPSLESLALVRRDESGRYVVKADGVRRGMDTASREQVLRRALLSYRPFEMLVEGLALGEQVDEAARKALRILGLPQTEMPRIKIMLKWAADLGVVEQANGGVVLRAEFSPTETEMMGVLSAEDVESEAKALLFNARRLGRDAANFLDETDRSLLADALLSYMTDPRKSIDASGQALEDFLREVADDRGLAANAKKANGASQVANVLYSNGVIANHHMKMVEAAATMRNATAHRKDKKTLKPWELTPAGAFAALAMTLTAIRSIHHFNQNGRQTI
jgi:Mn-dependent DtxR family transcriptional regulator